MKIMGVDHVTINVRDIEASMEFYGSVLKLPFVETVDMGDHEITYYKLSDTTNLELIRYKFESDEMKTGQFTKGVYRHLALAVDDAQEVFERLKASGAEIVTEPSYIEKLGFTGFLFTDPNGVEIEAVQRA
ncbi:MAG TPA: VOC family protein [Lachnospiraceae bacterium]|nr:VOC family protein [Lachnospiraceae bacterium]